MTERPRCHCPLCRIETELLTELMDSTRMERCHRILSSAPALSAFSGAGPLLAHLRLCRETSCSDELLRALLQAKRIFADGTVERLFILAFLPSLHVSLRRVARRYPQMSPEDASQQALQSLLRFLDSEELHSRQNYLGFAIARRMKRTLFGWAEHEMRPRVFELDDNAQRFDSTGNSFERLAILRHFLDRAHHRGILNGEELGMLIQFKLESGFEGSIPECSSNARRQRLKRLLSKLRRLAKPRRSFAPGRKQK